MLKKCSVLLRKALVFAVIAGFLTYMFSACVKTPSEDAGKQG